MLQRFFFLLLFLAVYKPLSLIDLGIFSRPPSNHDARRRRRHCLVYVMNNDRAIRLCLISKHPLHIIVPVGDRAVFQRTGYLMLGTRMGLGAEPPPRLTGKRGLHSCKSAFAI